MAQTSTMENLARTERHPMDRIHPEEMTTQMERRAARLPSFWFLGMAMTSMVASALLAIFAHRKEFANFVGLWAPSFLLIGIYNRLVQREEWEISSGRGSSMEGRETGFGSSTQVGGRRQR